MRFPRTLLAAVLLFACAVAAANVRAPLWRQVRAATDKGLPKTALAPLPALIAGAEHDSAWAEAARAVLLRVALEARIQGNKPEERITRLQAELPRVPAPMRPLLHAVLAEWYWQYFQEHRWQFMQRSATSAAPDSDFTTWDLRRIYAEIDAHFTQALADAPALRAVPIAAWDDLLAGGNSPDAYRPTLYDFAAFEALRFWQSGEQAGARPEDAFVLRADSPVLDSAGAFVRWRVTSPDSAAPAYRAVRLYQDLIAWHASRRDTAAMLDADLWRLDFARNTAVGESKQARCLQAYRQLAERWAGHEVSTRALAAWAEMLEQSGDRVAAHALAERGAARFRGSIGSNRCFNLLRQIEGRELEVTTEAVWNGAHTTLDVRYRNLRAVHFRLVPWDFAAKCERNVGPWAFDGDELTRALAAAPAREWTDSLRGTPDYQQYSEHLEAPAGIRPGCYVLLSSARGDFRVTDNVVGATVLWVSDLALVVRNLPGALDGLVLDAETGEPVAGADVRCWGRPGASTLTEMAGVRSDSAGHFRWETELSVDFVSVQAGSRRLAQSLALYPRQPEMSASYQRTVLFTDRALYRPGQVVHAKGICIDVDQAHDRYRTLAAQAVTLVLSDANGREVARRECRTNDYGSFACDFDAPRDRLLGVMSLRVTAGPQGYGWLRVEEYKRPKFFVQLDAPRTGTRLDSTVTVSGRAMAYTGAAVDGASVKWRVTRSVRYPGWWAWRYWGRLARDGGSQEIAHGEASVAGDGRFAITFIARADSTAGAEDEPSFEFAIHADVTEPAGETRSADGQVVVGYTALAASMDAQEWQTTDRPVALDVRTTTLDGAPQAARGTITVVRLQQPAQVQREPLAPPTWDAVSWQYGAARNSIAMGASDPLAWAAGDTVVTLPFATDTLGARTVAVALPAGLYRVLLASRDAYGRRVTAERPLQVLDLAATRFAARLPDFYRVRSATVEVGEDFTAAWGTGYDSGRAYVEVQHHGRTVQAWWTPGGVTQAVIRVHVGEEMRGGFTVRVTSVHANRAYVHATAVDVPWTDRVLALRWEHFTSNLRPGQHETWTAVVAGADATRRAAEMVATLYDASLDAYGALNWPAGFDVFRHDQGYCEVRVSATLVSVQQALGGWAGESRDGSLDYREFPRDLLWGQYDGALVPSRLLAGRTAPGAVARPRPGPHGIRTRVQLRGVVPMRAGTIRSLSADALSAPMPAAGQAAYEQRADKSVASAAPMRGGRAAEVVAEVANGAASSPVGSSPPNLDTVNARHDLRETAFFFPQIMANDRGEVRMEFTMPEGVTRWRFLGFAHDRDLRSGLLTGEAVTTRELMVQPNAPRFLREGDTLEFTVKVTNLGSAPQAGRVRLKFADAASGAAADSALGIARSEQPFAVPARESRTFTWTLRVPDGMGALTYTAVAASAQFSDGEDGVLPVLSRSVLVTESLPLPIRGGQTRTFDFERLERSGATGRVRSQSLTLQMVSNPSWYAVMALPYLMEYPYECSEQTFNRLYANQLARHIAGHDPRIRRVFDAWRDTPALESPLETNAALKSVALVETPWVRQAESESQARRNVGVLFDDARLDREGDAAYAKLAAMQLSDGAWPWFPGGRGNDYFTLYITTGFGRLRHLGVNVPMEAAVRSLRRLDQWSDALYQDIRRHGKLADDHLSPTIALYLYGRSFFLADEPFAPRYRESRDYWLAQARSWWLQLDSRQSQAQLALALQRFGDPATARAILASLREHAVQSDELGMYWRDEERSWWWYRAPIETQATLIEAFDEVGHDSLAVEACRVWLLKQKQAQDWTTTRATADAVYALLLRGGDRLSSDAPVQVTLGGREIRPAHVEAGSGFWEQRFDARAIRPEMGHVTVRKTDAGVAWGSLHWQYLADVNDVTPYAGTPLTLQKSLWVRRPSAAGPRLEPLVGPAQVGDELVVRLTLRTDRDMEYVHMKDGRGSGTEPVDVLSGYRWQDGLGYYEETRDAGTHFFFDTLPKGTYVFEYSVRIQHRGRYPSGIAEIQCMYAPEFNGHSQSVPIVAR